ncbi:hypothetical protein [Ruminiclostridium cellulolyticum]|uniref:Nucleic acid binding OB-fold tRNA/helicase-type n=1 Tax=Ruminiclostridium cellulolyticum (strain ATCC 35319 / DSM 5812 / JCM 6584 / H10) TaxID=394503 RepID=B8I6V8_RUMCH|nr:hypothetical protein [Ruminiclostridium cellulolyticum]ACL76950.1 hypothetical protein Ccel_2622 [Ruminiclostridium cellulolyticum H10]
MCSQRTLCKVKIVFLILISIFIFSGCSSQDSENSQFNGRQQKNETGVNRSNKKSFEDKLKNAKPFTEDESMKITEEKFKKQLKLLRSEKWNVSENDILKNGNIERLVSVLNNFKDPELPRYTVLKPKVKDILKNMDKYYGEKINFTGRILKISKNVKEESIDKMFDGEKFAEVYLGIEDEKVKLYTYRNFGILNQFEEGDKIEFSGWPVGTSENILVLVNRGIF